MAEVRSTSIEGRRRFVRAGLVTTVLSILILGASSSAFAATNSSPVHPSLAQQSIAKMATSQERNTVQKSAFAPSIATLFTGTVAMAYVANNGTGDILVTTSSDGIHWSTPVNTGQRTKESPAIAFWDPEGDDILIAFVADNSGNDLLVITSVTGGDTWSADEKTGQKSSTAPATCSGIIAFVADNSSGDLVTITSSNGSTWSSDVTVGSQESKTAPAIAQNASGEYILTYVANNSSNDLIETTSSNGTTWSTDMPLGVQASKTAPAISAGASRNDLLISYVANNSSDDLLVTASTDGGATWSASASVTGQSSGEAPGVAVVEIETGDSYWIVTYVAKSGNDHLLATTSGNGIDWSSSMKVGGERPA